MKIIIPDPQDGTNKHHCRHQHLAVGEEEVEMQRLTLLHNGINRLTILSCQGIEFVPSRCC